MNTKQIMLIAAKAGAIFAAVSAAMQIICEIFSRCAGYGPFYRWDAINGIVLGVSIVGASFAIMALVALMALFACFLAEVCGKRAPALEEFFESIARSLANQLKG